MVGVRVDLQHRQVRRPGRQGFHHGHAHRVLAAEDDEELVAFDDDAGHSPDLVERLAHVVVGQARVRAA